MARDHWGHGAWLTFCNISILIVCEGVPVAWMLSSNGTQATIQYFLNLVKSQSPGISLSIFMTDRDHTQVNAIRSTFPKCPCVFYCWWHVLWAIQTHFNMKEFPELWSLIRDWVCITDDNEFNVSWKYIQEDTSVPKSLAEYIAREWLPHKDMWSVTSHQNWSIFEEGDTNMLLEAYVIAHINMFIFIYLFLYGLDTTMC